MFENPNPSLPCPNPSLNLRLMIRTWRALTFFGQLEQLSHTKFLLLPTQRNATICRHPRWSTKGEAQFWPCFSSDFPACQSWPAGKLSPKDIARELLPAGDLAQIQHHSGIIYLLRNIRTLLPSSSHATIRVGAMKAFSFCSTTSETFPSGVQCGHPLSSVIGGRCRWGRNLRRDCLYQQLRDRTVVRCLSSVWNIVLTNWICLICVTIPELRFLVIYRPGLRRVRTIWPQRSYVLRHRILSVPDARVSMTSFTV